MKIIFDKDFNDLNIKIYYIPEMVELYLYVENELIGESFFFESETSFNDTIFNLFPSYLVELFDDKFDDIIHELYIRLSVYYFGCDNFLAEELGLNYDVDLTEFLLDEFKKLHQLEYSDNFRFCQVGDIEQEVEYDRRYKKGCCGFEDKVVEFNKIKYKIGCNYGH